MNHSADNLTGNILAAFNEAGTAMRFDVAQPLLQALQRMAGARDAETLDRVIDVYRQLDRLTTTSPQQAT